MFLSLNLVKYIYCFYYTGKEKEKLSKLKKCSFKIFVFGYIREKYNNCMQENAAHRQGLSVAAVWHSLQCVWFFSTVTHVQMSDTGVILICFPCRSETSWTKAHFSTQSGIEVQYVPKIFAQTLYSISFWEVIQ